MLSSDSYNKAITFIRENARTLDKLVYEVEFEQGSPEAVIDELIKFQNEDGGFGHGLEPDIRLTESSVLCTTVALQYLNNLTISLPADLIAKIMKYLSNQLFWENSMPYWVSVPLSITSIQHPPWWHLEEVNTPSLEHWSNPTVEIIGYFNKYREHVDKKLMDKLNGYLEMYLENHRPNSEDFFSYLCWKRVLPHIPSELQTKAFAFLDNINDENFSPDKLGPVHPHLLVTEETSYLFQKFPETMKGLLQHEIDEQSPDGGWYPNWKWEHIDWDKIALEWAGKLTVELLTTLKYCKILNIY